MNKKQEQSDKKEEKIEKPVGAYQLSECSSLNDSVYLDIDQMQLDNEKNTTTNEIFSEFV